MLSSSRSLRVPLVAALVAVAGTAPPAAAWPSFKKPSFSLPSLDDVGKSLSKAKDTAVKNVEKGTKATRDAASKTYKQLENTVKHPGSNRPLPHPPLPVFMDPDVKLPKKSPTLKSPFGPQHTSKPASGGQPPPNGEPAAEVGRVAVQTDTSTGRTYNVPPTKSGPTPRVDITQNPYAKPGDVAVQGQGLWLTRTARTPTKTAATAARTPVNGGPAAPPLRPTPGRSSVASTKLPPGVRPGATPVRTTITTAKPTAVPPALRPAPVRTAKSPATVVNPVQSYDTLAASTRPKPTTTPTSSVNRPRTPSPGKPATPPSWFR